MEELLDGEVRQGTINSLLIVDVDLKRLAPNSPGMLGYSRSMIMGDLGDRSIKIRIVEMKVVTFPACRAQTLPTRRERVDSTVGAVSKHREI